MTLLGPLVAGASEAASGRQGGVSEAPGDPRNQAQAGSTPKTLSHAKAGAAVPSGDLVRVGPLGEAQRPRGPTHGVAARPGGQNPEHIRGLQPAAQ